MTETVDLEVGKSYELYFNDHSGRDTLGKRSPALIAAVGERFVKINSTQGKGELISKDEIVRAVPINPKKEAKP